MPPRRPRSPGFPSFGLALALSTAALALFGAENASAQPLPKLAVNRSETALDCPDAGALAASVERLMKRPALDPSPGSSPKGAITVHIRGGPQGYTAAIQAGDRTREIADPWPTCAGLSEGLPLTLAILLDSDEPLVSASEQPAPLIPITPPPAASPAALPSIQAPPPSPSPAEKTKITGLSIQIGAAASAGLLGPFDLGIQGDADFRFASSFAVGAGAFWLAPRTISFPPGEVDVSLWAGFLRGCSYILGSPERTRLALCGHAALGVLEGRGSGYFKNETSTRPWIALGGAGLVEGVLWSRLGWAARLSFFIPAVKESFEVTNIGLAFEPAEVGVLLGLGGRVSIW
ncbi:MAG: hypothetical protein L6Q76_04670 [Polyangiaceae bacterium]|nr:hypothetical protein [Polyangiaceae bacterium]